MTILVVLSASCNDNYLVVNNDTMLYIPFDGSLSDFSGNHNDGSSNQPSYTADALNRPNRAYAFDGLNNFITIPHSISLDPAHQVTISFWLRVDSIQSNYMPILVKGGPVSGYFENREYAVYAKYDSDTLWYPQLKSAGDGKGMHELDSDGKSYGVGRWNSFVFVVDRVHHIMEIFANGLKTHEVVDTFSNFTTNTYPLLIGWSEENLAGHTPLRGAMDNLHIYNRALSPGEVLTLYNSRN
ncbi:MAG TPA: LamG domain-containing protein [Bacteroidota bacterium]|jgi:hypothetical protein|nr:LamG domain-containing protein [Bacteroidota bacterium]